jgi:myxalamid-type polyketide synthase MxaE and MxaD
MLERHLREEAGRILRMPPERIEPTVSLVSLGLSSLTALEYRNRLEASLGATFPATLIWSHPTTAALTDHVAARLGLALDGQKETKKTPAAEEHAERKQVETKLAAEIDRLSEAEAEQALLAALEGIETDS